MQSSSCGEATCWELALDCIWSSSFEEDHMLGTGSGMWHSPAAVERVTWWELALSGDVVQ